MLKNALTLATGGVDTAENEPLKAWGHGVRGIELRPPSGHGVNRRNKYRSGHLLRLGHEGQHAEGKPDQGHAELRRG